MQDVKTVKLGEIIERPISGEWGEDGDTVKVLRSTNFTNDGFLNLTDVVTRHIPARKVEQKQLQVGDTIIEKSGGGPNQPVGRVVYFDQTDGPYLCSNFTSVLRAKSNVSGKYLFWFLLNQHAANKTLRYQNKTTGIINLQLSRYLQEIKIPLPDLDTQRHIAAVLDRADALRQKDRQLLACYGQLPQAVFLAMFGDPVRNEKGWDRRTLGNLIVEGPQNGLYKSATDYGSGTPILRIDSFYDGSVTDIDSLKRVNVTEKERELYQLRPQNIVINRVNSRSHLGKSALIPDLKEQTIFESNMMRFAVDTARMAPSYLIKMLGQNSVKRQILERAKDAVNQASINQRDVLSFEVLVPPLPLQAEFARTVERIERQKAVVNQQLAASEALFQSLLHRYFG